VSEGPVRLVYLCLEVAGCPTVCRHCWAQGTGYGMMPLADVEWVLARAHEYCDGRGLGFDSYPMQELAAHPDAAELFGLFNSHSGTVAGGTMFEPWPTTGVPLALREDWRDVLRAAAGTGTECLWLAFHGVGEVHDRQVSRPGAYAESCLAAERARDAGLSVGCNVFLTRDSLPRLDELIGVVGRLADEGACFETPGFLPTPRSRHHERLRLTLPDLAPWATRLGELANPVGRSQWADRWRGGESRTTRSGSGPGRCPGRTSWPRGTATRPASGCTWARSPHGTCGWTARAGPAAAEAGAAAIRGCRAGLY
jgi:hypothetical protein